MELVDGAFEIEVTYLSAEPADRFTDLFENSCVTVQGRTGIYEKNTKRIGH